MRLLRSKARRACCLWSGRGCESLITCVGGSAGMSCTLACKRNCMRSSTPWTKWSVGVTRRTRCLPRRSAFAIMPRTPAVLDRLTSLTVCLSCLSAPSQLWRRHCRCAGAAERVQGHLHREPSQPEGCAGRDDVGAGSHHHSSGGSACAHASHGGGGRKLPCGAAAE